MAKENLKQILKLIATEVARERHHTSAFDEEKHPRDEHGQFIAIDVAAEAAQARHPDAHDDKDYKTGRARDIERKLRERGLLKKTDEPKPLSDTARRLEDQTLSQLADHGRVHDVPLPRNAEHLFADYKHHPHKPMASLLKYIVHRVENQHRYDTPADAARADKEFLKSRETALVYSRADPTIQLKQPPIEHLHNQLAQAPHLIDEVMAHQRALHDHLTRTGKIKMIDGQPHVALTRGLGSGTRRPDPMLTSFADTHENTLGGRVKFFHNHWVPLKNVWYSYDHGPKASHPSHYFPAQDEFLVSPHKLKTALSTDVKKLVPRKPKAPRPAKTAPEQPKKKLASSAEPHKMYTHRDFQHFSALALLQKSGQYTKLEPWITQKGNESGFVDAKERAKAKTQLTERGKLDPKDIEKIIQNRNVHVYNMLLDRSDLTKDQLMAMALHPDDFKTRGGAEGNREDEAYNKLYEKLGRHSPHGEEGVFHEIAQKGGNVAVQNMLQYAKHRVHGDILMHLVTERKDLDSPTMHKVIAHDKFDNGHLAEILHSPHSSVIVQAVREAENAPPNIMDAALQHENPKVRAGILGRGGSQRFDDRQVIRGLDDQDPDVRRAAAGQANTPKRARHILDNHLNSPNATEMLDKMLDSGPFGYYNDPNDDKDWLDEGDLRRIVDYGIEKDPRILTHTALRNRKKVPADSVMKIMQMPDTKARETSDGTPRAQRLKAEWMSHPAVTPEHIDAALAGSSDAEVMRAISDHKHASAEQLREAWKRVPKDKDPNDWRGSRLAGWTTNLNTPTDVLSEAAKMHEQTGNIKALISHPNLDPNVLKAFQAHENPQYRAYAAENPNAQASHMTAGLADKDKTVRNAWMSHPGLQPEHLATALKDRAPSNREIVAAHPGMTPDLLAKILKNDKSEDVRFAAISNKNATPDMMRDVLMNDPSKKMRAAVLKHAQLTPELIDHVLKHDSDHDIRATMLRHPNLTADHVRHVALNDPNDQIRRMALNHAKADSNLIQDAIEKAPSHALSETLQDNANLRPEHVARLYDASMRHHAALPPVDPNDRNTRWALEIARSSAMDTIHKLVQHPAAPDSVRGHFIEHGPLDRAAALVRQDIPKSRLYAGLGGLKDEAGNPIQENHTTSLTSAHLLAFHDRMNKVRAAQASAEGTPPARIRELEGLPSALASHDKFKESGLLDRFAHSQDTTERGLAAEHHELPKELVNKLADDPSHEIRHGIAGREDLDDATIDKLIRKDQHHDVLEKLTTNPTIQHDVSRLNRIWNVAKEAGEFWRKRANLPEGADDDYIDARKAVLSHPNVSMQLLQEGIKDHHPAVKSAASKSLSHLDPDAYNQTRDGAHDIDVHPATEKLKHLKGQIEEAGGKIHKRDLPGQGQGLPKELFDSQGYMTSQNTEQYLKSLPHQKYNITYRRWKGAQRHSTADQAVVQLNMTNDHVRQLKEQGLFDTFKKMHAMSFSSGHPVDHHSLGWARVDDSHPEHWHIDEIQSDFGQNTIRQVEQMKRQQDEQGDQDHKPFGNVPLETVIDHLKKINKVFAGGFKNINHAIHAAVHAVGRKKGIKSTSMDTLKDQMKQSNMRTKDEAPGHMINTYQDQPAKDGYGVKPKKAVMPNTDAPEEEVQYRKLVKSVAKLRGLVDKYKATTAGRHSEAPAKEAGGKHAPVAKKPANRKHIRADTQTEVNLHYEKGR